MSNRRNSRQPGLLRHPSRMMVIPCMLLFCLAIGGRHASAHHSFAMYDPKQLLTVTGTVKSFQWSNPHVILWLVDGPRKDGSSELWTLELPTSPGVLTRLGWDKHSLQPGDRIVAEFNPLRTGEHGGSFKRATLVDTGKVLEVKLAPAAKPEPPQP